MPLGAGWLLPKSAATRPADQGGGHEIMGFPLTESMAAAVKRIDLAALAPALPGRTLVVVSQPLRSHESLQRALGQRPAPLTIEYIDSPPGWIEWPIHHPLAGTVPVKVLQTDRRVDGMSHRIHHRPSCLAPGRHWSE